MGRADRLQTIEEVEFAKPVQASDNRSNFAILAGCIEDGSHTGMRAPDDHHCTFIGSNDKGLFETFQLPGGKYAFVNFTWFIDFDSFGCIGKFAAGNGYPYSALILCKKIGKPSGVVVVVV
jgi:hypothetical protein